MDGVRETGRRYLNPRAPIEARVDDLIAIMSLDEKLAQLGGAWFGELIKEGRVDEEHVVARIPYGIGEVTRIGGSTGLRPEESARLFNQLQRVVVTRTRLGIPVLVHEEAIGGYCAREATVFPQSLALAASWDPRLLEEVAATVRRQMMAVGARHALAPVLDVARDPRWGRVEETYGEDPVLCGAMGSAFVRGLQSDDLSRGVMATGKHFVGHGMPEGGRNHASVQLGPRELREIYVEPFAAAIREAGLASVMNSYSSVDGVPCGSSKELLQDILRGELGFDGIVVSDYFAVALLMTYHKVAEEKGGAAAAALIAGIDVELPVADCFGEPLKYALETGRVGAEHVDSAVRRVLTAKFGLGLFDQPFAPEPVLVTFDGPDERVLARRAAQEAIVLLSNDGILPLSDDIARIAVLGPASDDPRLLQGDYHYPAHLEPLYEKPVSTLAGNDGKEQSPLPSGRGAFQPGAFYTPHVTPLAAIKAAIREPRELRYEKGCELTGPGDAQMREKAVDAARNSDVAIVFLGERSGLTLECTVGEGRDATDLRLTGAQEELLASVAKTGTPTVAVVLSGRVHVLTEIARHAAALVLTWPLGEEGGMALADVLFGAVSPSGRLPVTLPRSVGQLPLYCGHRSGASKSMFYGDYIDEVAAPLFGFGHGLSYATFSYSDFELQCATTRDMIKASVVVENTCERAGVAVAQLYLRNGHASVARPEIQLLGFTKVAVPGHGAARILFEVHPSRLAFYDADFRFVVEPGSIELCLGRSSVDVCCSATATLLGDVLEYRQVQVISTKVTVSKCPNGSATMRTDSNA
jgi:beta-glucosidase